MQSSNSFFLKRLFYSKRFTVIFSLLAAFVLWLVIMISQNPEIERSFTDISLQINLENTTVSNNGMEIIGDLSEQKFTVTVNGPSYVVSALTASDVYVYASAAQVDKPETYQLNVIGAKKNTAADYEIIAVSPKTVSVKFDYVDTKEFTLKPNAPGVVAEKGLIADTPVVSGVESDTVTIEGARSVVNKISSVEAYTDAKATLNASETFDAEIRLYNEEGKRLEGEDLKYLKISVSAVKVTVPIVKSATVKVIPQFTNLPDNFDQSSIPYTVDHPTVEVIGTPSAVEGIDKITLSPIDITSVSKNKNRFEVTAKLPEGVRLKDNITSFAVTVDLTDYAEKTVTVSRFKGNNLASGLKAGMVGEIKNVTIFGKKDVLDALKEDELYAVADLKDKAKGEYTVEVIIQSDTVHTVWQVGTCQATVKIQ